jgi:hypothetical protein
MFGYRAAKLAQRFQQAFGRFEISCFKTFNELLEYGLQKRPAAFALALTSQQTCQVGRGPQFPCSCALASAQFERLRKA